MSSGSLLAGYDVVVCQDCGFCFADNIPEQRDFDVYYENMSKYAKSESSGKSTPYEDARYATSAKFIQSLHPPSELNILEIGCATGGLLGLLKRKGYPNVVGIDPSAACAETARRLYGVQVHVAKFSDLTLPEHSFDLIVMTGVLEHVRDLDQALLQLTRLLTRHGLLYIAVPDASRYAEGEDAPFQEFSVEHINFFGPGSLTNLMGRHGYDLVSCEQTSVEANYKTHTPIIQAAYRKRVGGACGTALKIDRDTVTGLLLYIKKSVYEDARVQSLVKKVAMEGESLIVWGTGSQALRLLEGDSLGQIRIHAFVDSNPLYQGKLLRGIRILAPHDLRGMKHPILIASRVYQKEIKEYIVSTLSLNNRLIELYDLD